MKYKLFRMVVTVAAASFLLSACSQAATSEPTLDLEYLLEDTSDYQRAIIEDGVVTAAEYEQALLARRDCVESAGADPGEIYDIGNNEQTFDFEITAATETDLNAIQEKADACLPEYFEDVGSVWAFQNLLTAEEREDLQPAVVACLGEAGFDVPADADLKRIVEIVAAAEDGSERARSCTEEFPAFFSVPFDAEDEHEDPDDEG